MLRSIAENLSGAQSVRWASDKDIDISARRVVTAKLAGQVLEDGERTYLAGHAPTSVHVRTSKCAKFGPRTWRVYWCCCTSREASREACRQHGFLGACTSWRSRIGNAMAPPGQRDTFRIAA